MFSLFQELDSRCNGRPKFVGPKLVAKESSRLGNGGEDRLRFHTTFAKTQLKAKRLAATFNRKVRERLGILGLPTSRAWDVSFVACSVYEFKEAGEVLRAVLAEKQLEPASRYTKWNGNAGQVYGAFGSAEAAEPASVQLVHAPPAEGMMEAIAEDGEEEEDASSVESINEGGASRLQGVSRSFAPRAECYPQAFSHFSYRHTRRKMLVCDLQGILSHSPGSKDRAGVFELTDPVIHYRSTRGLSHVCGKTDFGKEGVDKFFKTHQCNEVCQLLGIGRVAP